MRKGQAWAFAGVALASIGCDHATKQLAEYSLSGRPGFSLAGDTLRFELVSNAGAFLSLGESLPEGLRDALLLVGVPALLAVFCVLALRGPGLGGRDVLALGMIVGGGLANWLDRIAHEGMVTDFVSLGLGPLRTGIFNLADVAIVAGLLLMLLPGSSALQRQTT